MEGQPGPGEERVVLSRTGLGWVPPVEDGLGEWRSVQNAWPLWKTSSAGRLGPFFSLETHRPVVKRISVIAPCAWMPGVGPI